jgi:hypothetical protein
MASSRAEATLGDNGLLGVLAQVMIGGCVVAALIAAPVRLARRGRSRMTTAMLICGAAVLGVALLGFLTSGR